MTSLTALRRRLSAPILVLSAVLVSAIAGAPAAWTQSADDVHIVPGSRPDSDEASAVSPELHARPLRKDVDLVLVPVTVSDAMNRPVINLTRQDFSLYENSVQQEIRFLSHEDAPMSIAFVLDCSASMKNKIEYEYQALQEFFSNANSEDEYLAVRVSDKPELIATASDSIATLQARLGSASPRGRTALFDAIYLAISQLRNAHYKRRAVLIISDGGDNTSRYTRGEIKKVIEETDVLTYAIGIFDEEPIPLLKSIEERMGRNWLSELTDASGGRTIAADDRHKIPEIAGIISRELRNQYLLGYRPTNSVGDGRWRKITVKVGPVSPSMRLQVHYREGYRPPTE